LIGAISQDLPAGLCAVALSPGVVDTRMLAVAFGASEASQAIDPDLWAKPAVDFLLSLSSADNGQSLTFSR
jgi:NAD(P)-dependent dehydrogenase (short-subunit alcohol dehydrogenase family)